MSLPTAIDPGVLDHGVIDWSRPWYGSIREAAATLLGHHVRHHDWLAALNRECKARALPNHRDLPMSFVSQAELPAGVAYEAFISSTGRVPTRNNLHDLFNALVWLSFPAIKRQLNALQAAQIARDGIGHSRGAARDAATIFDENCALVVVSDTLHGAEQAEAMRNHHWHRIFLEQRDAFNQHAEVWLFGHALMEKLVTPYKSITAHAWVVTAPVEFFSMTAVARRTWLDARVANDLLMRHPDGLTTARFTPLPVLGVPGWWPAQDRQFYDDATVFRPRRGDRQTSG